MRAVTEAMMQDKAVRTWQERGYNSPEYVALAFGHRWFELHNMHQSAGQFDVAHNEVLHALEVAHDLGISEARIVLWHSHVRTQEPSAYDLANLPAWVAQGLIYHAPTQTTVAYSGMHFALRAASKSAIATSEEARHG